jgi:hypothetical protein
MLTSALFTIAKAWSQSRHPSADEWVEIMCVDIMEYYSAI